MGGYKGVPYPFLQYIGNAGHARAVLYPQADVGVQVQLHRLQAENGFPEKYIGAYGEQSFFFPVIIAQPVGLESGDQQDGQRNQENSGRYGKFISH